MSKSFRRWRRLPCWSSLWFLHAAASYRLASFHALLLAIPLFVSFKHGFVRQDDHIVNFFCFVAVALALASLTINLHGTTLRRVGFLMILFLMIWQDNVGKVWGMSAVTQSTGVRGGQMLWGALRFDRLKQKLHASVASFPEDERLEPELVTLIGASPIASLSISYTNLPAAGLHVRLYPVLERYAAFTPYLDGLNAAWIRDQGPRFLVFDGKTIDDRDPWAETPAMWLEIYRWYDTRLLGTRNLLLERRSTPRFTTARNHWPLPHRLPRKAAAAQFGRSCLLDHELPPEYSRADAAAALPRPERLHCHSRDGWFSPGRGAFFLTFWFPRCWAIICLATYRSSQRYSVPA